ncbi:MAG: heavy metal translocating P-type ATPase metal-binding domain-containing protein [Bacteroidota bacterium]|nr:heavy metal translocating P-type ATPase metal-binding domain-containing protein [Bacteroidota bacterium]
MPNKKVIAGIKCYHCGDHAGNFPINFDNKHFCCTGCRGVYEILADNNLCDYYTLDSNPGLSLKNPVSRVKFNYLDDEQIQKQLIDYRDEKISKVTFHIPSMHCSSCIWLLESLYKLEKGILFNRVDFLKKQLSVSFDHHKLSLRKLVEMLSSLGYEPALNLSNLDEAKRKDNGRRLLYQIGVAGFCFGNIMLISFPEYFGLDRFSQQSFSRIFGFLNMALALPVFLYSARDYFIAAFKSLRKGVINIDFPLALGILVMFVRSSYEVISHTGIGFFDTLAGLVFFLLIGKWVQNRTFETLSFERDYKSYFPVAVSVLKDNLETTLPVTKLKIGDRIIIHNNEIIPADSILLGGEALIDFSFVTGESLPVSKVFGEIIYAGGRQVGGTLELEVSKSVSQSYLTQLWNSEHFAKENKSSIKTFQSVVSKYFTIVLLCIAFTAALYWFIKDPSLSSNAFTAVLIIACPCALALSSPFALGNSLRMLSRSKFYLKSPGYIEHMAKIDSVVFDKTGTITQAAGSTIYYEGAELSTQQKLEFYSLCSNSVHPLSKKIANFLGSDSLKKISVHDFKEITGRGIEGIVNGISLRAGSHVFIDGMYLKPEADLLLSYVYLSYNNKTIGNFCIKHAYRDGLKPVLHKMGINRKLSLLSGDRDAERSNLKQFFPETGEMLFNQSPADKMLFIDTQKLNGFKVAMIGDGLNDAGALKVADLGICVTENTAHFSPASDVIMDAAVFEKLPDFFNYAKDTVKVIRISFVISLLYNVIGLSFAVKGVLSPVMAAILMPLSSISVILFTTAATYLYAIKNKII